MDAYVKQSKQSDKIYCVHIMQDEFGVSKGDFNINKYDYRI
jgi:predicted secreted protein